MFPSRCSEALIMIDNPRWFIIHSRSNWSSLNWVSILSLTIYKILRTILLYFDTLDARLFTQTLITLKKKKKTLVFFWHLLCTTCTFDRISILYLICDSFNSRNNNRPIFLITLSTFGLYVSLSIRRIPFFVSHYSLSHLPYSCQNTILSSTLPNSANYIIHDCHIRRLTNA